MGSKLTPLLFAIACRGEPAVPDCAAAVGGVIDHLSALEDKGLDEMPADSPRRQRLNGDKLERYRRRLHDESECAKRAITKACIDDAWSETARTCMFHANDLPDCADALTAQQRERTERAAAPCDHHDGTGP